MPKETYCSDVLYTSNFFLTMNSNKMFVVSCQK